MHTHFGRLPALAFCAALLLGHTSASAQVGALSPASWGSIGPVNVGGRIRAILINPVLPSDILIGSPGGGLWRTSDSGATWAPVEGYAGNPVVTWLAAEPNNFGVMYAGTGEAFETNGGRRGSGIYKSVDGGTTWTHLSSTATDNFHYVNRIAVAPGSAIILVATNTGLHRSTDGGATFTHVSGGGLKGALDVDFDPTNQNLAVASGYEGRAWYSTNGGATFSPASGLPLVPTALRRVEIAYAPSAPATVYALVKPNLTRYDAQLFRSTNGGASFSPGSTFSIASTSPSSAALFVDPTNPNVIIAGADRIVRSLDGGLTFQPTAINVPSSPDVGGANYHVIVAASGFNGATIRGVYVGSDFGLHGTGDIYNVSQASPEGSPAAWFARNLGLPIAQFTSIAVRESTSTRIGGTLTRGVMQQIEGGLFWSNGAFWDASVLDAGGFVGIDQQGWACYGARSRLRIRRTACGTTGALDIWSGIDDAESPQTANAVAPFVLDPSDERRIVGGGATLWRTDDARLNYVTWYPIKDATDSLISAIAIQRYASDQVWVGHNNGDIYRTGNATTLTPTWTKVDVSLPDRIVTRLAVDPLDPETAYATFDGFSGDNIWKTTNGGLAWSNVHGFLPQVPIRTIVIHPANPAWLYVGTDVGVFASEDGGTTWSVANQGPADVSVTDLVFSNMRTLYAATHGRGVFRAVLDFDPPPGRVRLLAPSGYTTLTPTYQWHANGLSTWYQLEVAHGGGRRFRQWYTAAQAGCASGGGTCRITPSAALVSGAAWWRIQTYNETAYGPWTDWRAFQAGPPSAAMLETYPVPNTPPGFTAPLWVLVSNTGVLALPAGSQAWIEVRGPNGYVAYAGFTDVTGLAPGAIRWLLVNWSVPYGRAPGSYTYSGRIWSTTFQRWISDWSAPRSFTIVPSPAIAAAILSTYRVEGAVPGTTVRLWALVKNLGTTPLTARVRFNVYSVWWIGSTPIVSLAPGAQQWYSFDWAIPANRPGGEHWYLAQVWDTGGAAPLSTASAWHPFTVGFDSQFSGTMDGWSGVTGTWSVVSNAFLYTQSAAQVGVKSAQYAVANYTNVDVTVRIWRDGLAAEQGVYIRGNPVPAPALVDGWRDGLKFSYTRSGTFRVSRLVNGREVHLTPDTFSSALVMGSAWNELRVRALGSGLVLYINGTFVWSGTDTAVVPGRVGVFGYRYSFESDFGLWIDYARLIALDDQ